MSTSKCIQILVLVLFPAGLLGMKGDFVQENNWIQEAMACPRAGAWTTQDKNGKTIIVEGELLSKDSKILSSEADIKNLATMFADVMDGTFVELANAYLIPRLYFNLKTLYTGKSGRDRFYDRCIEDIGKAMSPNNCEPCYLFTVSEQLDGKKVLLGAAFFDIEKNYAYGTVELDILSVKPEAQGRSLSTILAGAIFNFLPQTKRIILDVLYTNKKAIDTYVSFGFTRYVQEHNCLYRLVDPEFHYEYLTDLPKCQKLQARAALFEDIKK